MYKQFTILCMLAILQGCDSDIGRDVPGDMTTADVDTETDDSVTFKGRPVSEWVVMADDVDEETSDIAWEALEQLGAHSRVAKEKLSKRIDSDVLKFEREVQGNGGYQAIMAISSEEGKIAGIEDRSALFKNPYVKRYNHMLDLPYARFDKLGPVGLKMYDGYMAHVEESLDKVVSDAIAMAKSRGATDGQINEFNESFKSDLDIERANNRAYCMEDFIYATLELMLAERGLGYDEISSDDNFNFYLKEYLGHRYEDFMKGLP